MSAAVELWPIGAPLCCVGGGAGAARGCCGKSVACCCGWWRVVMLLMRRQLTPPPPTPNPHPPCHDDDEAMANFHLLIGNGLAGAWAGRRTRTWPWCALCCWPTASAHRLCPPPLPTACLRRALSSLNSPHGAPGSLCCSHSCSHSSAAHTAAHTALCCSHSTPGTPLLSLLHSASFSIRRVLLIPSFKDVHRPCVITCFGRQVD